MKKGPCEGIQVCIGVSEQLKTLLACYCLASWTQVYYFFKSIKWTLQYPLKCVDQLSEGRMSTSLDFYDSPVCTNRLSPLHIGPCWHSSWGPYGATCSPWAPAWHLWPHQVQLTGATLLLPHPPLIVEKYFISCLFHSCSIHICDIRHLCMSELYRDGYSINIYYPDHYTIWGGIEQKKSS